MDAQKRQNRPKRSQKRKIPIKEAKVKKNAKKQIRKRVVPQLEGQNNFYSQCASQFVVPEDSVGILIPDEAAAPRCVRRFKTFFDVRSDTPGLENGIRVVARASLQDPVLYTGSSNLFPATPGPMSITGSGFIASTATQFAGVGSQQSLWTPSVFVARVGEEEQAGQFDVLQDGAGTGFNAIRLSNVAVGPGLVKLALLLKSTDKGSIRLDICGRSTSTGLWVLIETVMVTAYQIEVDIGQLDYTELGFNYTGTAVTSHHVLHYAVYTLSEALIQLNMITTTALTGSHVTQRLSEDAQGARLTGMSLMISNTSSQLASGGDAYAARVPAEVSYFSAPATIQQNVPPTHFMNGIASEGCYAWWLPKERPAMGFLDLDEAQTQLQNEDYLFASLEGWGGNGYVSTARVTVVYMVEFFDKSQFFEKRIPPLVNDRWREVMAALAHAPAATHNPSHENLKRLVQRMVNAGSTVFGHYKKYQSLYDGLFSGLLGSVLV